MFFHCYVTITAAARFCSSLSMRFHIIMHCFRYDLMLRSQFQRISIAKIVQHLVITINFHFQQQNLTLTFSAKRSHKSWNVDVCARMRYVFFFSKYWYMDLSHRKKIVANIFRLNDSIWMRRCACLTLYRSQIERNYKQIRNKIEMKSNKLLHLQWLMLWKYIDTWVDTKKTV